ncbi:kinase-like domain-containing protein [Suillus placidus]|uniref:Kinase-like domain-containing protein n=1 Tax=Suillus placidus TaxID=48579 RepID=A0A9P7A1A0_9AGAM|nr:kinase-like domain-containing protein [Suillus placidus]
MQTPATPPETKEVKDPKEHEDEESDEDVDPLDKLSFVLDSCSSNSPAMLQDLTESITKTGNYPVARGGFGEIWKCTYRTERGPIAVAVKSLLVYASDQFGEVMEKKTKRIRREIRTCARLKHHNILPWAENGNLTTYLEREDAHLTMVRRFQILRDVTDGLHYLHTNNVIHGDLTGPNVLIHGNGTACLADFGLSLVYSEVLSTSLASWTSTFHGNFRWLAPELLGEPDDELPIRPSKCSDVYSFGGIMLQVLTGRPPYYYLSEAAVIQRIGNGVKPLRSRYPAFSDKYWHLIEECWSIAPQNRPLVDRVVRMIGDEQDSLSSS